MDYYVDNPSHQDQIDYIVFDCIVNEQAKIYSKEEWESYLSSLLLLPPLDLNLSPDVLGSLWEIDALLIIQSIKRQTLDMRAQLERLNMRAGKHSAKIALQINEMKLQLEMQAVECYKLLVEEPHGSRVREDEVVIEDDKVEFPFMPSGGQENVDLVKYDGLDAYVDASKSAQPLVLHGKSMREEVKKGACHLRVEDATIFLKPFILPSSCFKLWDPGGSSYMFTITRLFFAKLWDLGGMSHVESTPWSFYHKIWDPGGLSTCKGQANDNKQALLGRQPKLFR